jgi:hypothetical protein
MLKFLDDHVADGDGAFDPETVQILVGAFDDAWKSLRARAAPVAAADYANVAREILAKKIIELATNGERSPRKLTEAALLQLAKSSVRKFPGGANRNSGRVDCVERHANIQRNRPGSGHGVRHPNTEAKAIANGNPWPLRTRYFRCLILMPFRLLKFLRSSACMTNRSPPSL